MARIRLTRFQLSELQHKCEVMRDDGASDGDSTMAGYYGFNEETLAEFYEKVCKSKGTLDLSGIEARAAFGEFGNAADIARDNIGFDFGDGPAYRAAARSFENAQDKIRAAFPSLTLEN